MRSNRIRDAVIAVLSIICITFAMTSCGEHKSDGTMTESGTQVVQEAEASTEETKDESTSESTSETTESTTKKASESKKKTTSTTKAAQASVCYVEVSGKTYTVSVASGDTAYSVLKKTGVSVSARNSEYGIYVEGINGKFEFDEGPQSGWLYSVNGVNPNVSASKYSVKKGDKVRWYYTSGN